MSDPSYSIREIRPEDNACLEKIIRAIFHEFGLPLTGTAFEDKETKNMYESYADDNEMYFVIERDGKVYGGAGIKPLKDIDSAICELQKMYFSPEIRGKGLGKKLFHMCLDWAKSKGYEKCYLESASELKTAVKMYESNGFEYLDGPLGNTGHFSCGIWMIKTL